MTAPIGPPSPYESIIHCYSQADAVALVGWCMRNNVSATRVASTVRMGHVGPVPIVQDHINAAKDCLAGHGIPMMERDKVAREVLEAAWLKAPWQLADVDPTDG